MGLLDALMGNDTKTVSLSGPNGVPMSGGAPSFSDRLSNPLTQVGLQLLANNGTPTTQGAFNGVPEALQRSAQAQEKNKTKEWLKTKYPDIYGLVQAGLDPGEAFSLAMRKEAEEREQKRYDANRAFEQGKFDYLKTQDQAELGLKRDTLAASSRTDDMKEYDYAVSRGYTGSLYDWQTKKAQAAAGRGGYGLNPVYGTDANGNTVIGQLGSDGTIVESKRPDGFRPLSPSELQFGKAKAGAEGKAVGEENAAAASVIASASEIDDQVMDLKNDAGLSSILGPLDSRTPNIFAGATGAQAKLNQLKGRAFMQARQLLKGGGQITDFEGKKAEQAMARLDQAQSVPDFIKALDDFNEAVQTGARRIAERTGSGPSGGGGTSGTSGNIGWRVK